MDSPNVKANLLLQAHLSRIPLPITDYITDTKSVLDQAVRVVQCMVDVAAHNGHLDTTLNLISFQQMIMQGQWQSMSTFKNIPHFNDRIIYKLSQIGIFHLCQLQARINTLHTLFKKDLREKLTTDQLKDIYRALNRVPLVSMKYTLLPVNGMGEVIQEPLKPGGEGLLTVTLNRQRHTTSRNVIIK